MEDGRVGFIGMLVIGLVAGWIAERVQGANHGLLTNLVVGIIGSFVGGLLIGVLGLHTRGFWGALVAATIGAIVFLWAWRAFRRS